MQIPLKCKRLFQMPKLSRQSIYTSKDQGLYKKIEQQCRINTQKHLHNNKRISFCNVMAQRKKLTSKTHLQIKSNQTEKYYNTQRTSNSYKKVQSKNKHIFRCSNQKLSNLTKTNYSTSPNLTTPDKNNTTPQIQLKSNYQLKIIQTYKNQQTSGKTDLIVSKIPKQYKQMEITKKNLILSKKYNFSLQCFDENRNQRSLMKSKSCRNKVQQRSFTQNPFLKGLNSKKVRTYESWYYKRVANQSQSFCNYTKQQENIKQNNIKQSFSDNIKIQVQYTSWGQFNKDSKFFICTNCLQIFLLIQVQNHNEVCELIYKSQQLQQKLLKIVLLLKQIYSKYYLQLPKYQCYFDTALTIQKSLIACNNKQSFLKNLLQGYQLQSFQTIMFIIQKNMFKDQLQKQKLIFLTIQSISNKNNTSLKQLLNPNDLFWLIGKLLEKLAYEKLTCYWIN